MFDQTVDVRPKFRFLTKIFIFYKNYFFPRKNLLTALYDDEPILLGVGNLKSDSDDNRKGV